MSWKSAMLATAVAGLFVAGGAATALGQEADDDKVRCEGVNSCKGKGACKGATHDCAGKNGCKGKGFMMMTSEECDKAKEEQEEPDEG